MSLDTERIARAQGSANQRVETRMIVHADDFGETVEITRGICTAIEAGAVTSTTIMASMPGTEDALKRVAALSDRASFGVHLNLCEGRPLTRGRSLVNDRGEFHRKRALFLRAVSGALSATDVEGEVYAQVARVRDAGVHISHVDGHKHMHQLPVVAAAVARVVPRFGIERVRLARLRTVEALHGPGTLVRELLAFQAAAVFSRAQLRYPWRVLDLRRIMPLATGKNVIAGLCEARGPVELFCHPGTAQADIEKPGSCARFAELQFLLSPAFTELVARHRLRLVNYWAV